MKIDIPIHLLVIKDKSSGETVTVKTMRSAKEIAGYIDETEKDILHDAIVNAVSDSISQP